MIDRQLLRDVGFEKGTGWDTEVWHYNGMFWVYFDAIEYDRGMMPDRTILISACTRQEFFKKFLEALVEEIKDSARVTW